MLIYLVFLIVCFGASIVGAICGIGGGVIIKPVLILLGVGCNCHQLLIRMYGSFHDDLFRIEE